MKRKNIKEKLKNYYFTKPSSQLRVREIERKVKIPLPSAIRYTQELTQENILREMKVGNVSFYTTDRTEDYFIEKQLYNIRLIHNSGLIDHLRQRYNNAPIILFGSYLRGEDTEDSDIDIFIETASTERVELKDFEKKISRKIQIIRSKSIEDISNVHLANNIINGLTLNNVVEVFR